MAFTIRLCTLLANLTTFVWYNDQDQAAAKVVKVASQTWEEGKDYY